jgi:hypothetical protein
MQAIPVVSETIIVSVSYADTWCKLFDNEAVGWLVDETGTESPEPVVLGTLPPAGEESGGPPQWGRFVDPYIVIPDHSRMAFGEFLTWLATSYSLKIASGMLYPALANYFTQWASQNPDLVQTDPVVAEAPPPEEPPPEPEPTPDEPAVEAHRGHANHQGRRRR